MAELSFLIVGLGSMGKRRIRNLLALGHKNIVGVDSREDRRREAEEKHGIKTRADFASALSELRPSAVIISTPPNLHTPFMLQCAKAGVPFFVEASVVNDGLDEVNAIAKKKGILAAPSCTFRFKQSISRIHDLLAAGRIGKIMGFTYHMGQYLPDWHPWEDYRQFYVSKKGIGAIREMVCFETQWLNWLFGELETISCMRAKQSALEIETDDFFAMLYQYKAKTGAPSPIGTVVVDILSRVAIRRLHIMGEQGNIVWDLDLAKVRLYDAGAKKWEEFAETERAEQKNYWIKDDMYIEEMRHFIGALQGRHPYMYSLEQDIRNISLLCAAEKSSDTKKQVNVGTGQKKAKKKK